MNKKRDITKLISLFGLDSSIKLEDNKERHFHHGYEYVDLGLPSGTLWATCNVGAEKPSDCGLYFAWGESDGYKDDSLRQFKSIDYKWFSRDIGNNTFYKKYNPDDNKNKLDIEDDAAHSNMGGKWHIPTNKQVLELNRFTFFHWTKVDDLTYSHS